MISAQARARRGSRHGAAPAAVLPRGTSSQLNEFSELIREVRDATTNARRMALEAEKSGLSSFGEALVLIFEGWMGCTSYRQQIVSFASAAELGVPLVHHLERCKTLVDENGMGSLRILFWLASRRMSQTLRRQTRAPAASAPAVKQAAPVAMCADCQQLVLDPCRAGPHAGLQILEADVQKRVSVQLSVSCCKFHCVQCGETWLRRSGGQPFSGWIRIAC